MCVNIWRVAACVSQLTSRNIETDWQTAECLSSRLHKLRTALLTILRLRVAHANIIKRSKHYCMLLMYIYYSRRARAHAFSTPHNTYARVALLCVVAFAAGR